MMLRRCVPETEEYERTDFALGNRGLGFVRLVGRRQSLDGGMTGAAHTIYKTENKIF